MAAALFFLLFALLVNRILTSFTVMDLSSQPDSLFKRAKSTVHITTSVNVVYFQSTPKPLQQEPEHVVTCPNVPSRCLQYGT